MSVLTWDDKIIYDDDGWGYRVSEGDDGEIIIYYFETIPEKTEREVFRFYNGEAGRALLKALKEKLDVMDYQGKVSEKG